MAYTTVPTITDIVATASAGNTYIRDNQRALKDPPSANHEVNEASNYTTSSDTWADIDTTDLTLSITTTGGAVMIGFVGSFIGGGNTGVVDVAVDSTRIVNQATGGMLFIVTDAGAKVYSFVHIIEGLSAGVHTFALQWRRLSGTITLYAGAATANYDVHPQFWARELT